MVYGEKHIFFTESNGLSIALIVHVLGGQLTPTINVVENIVSNSILIQKVNLQRKIL